MLEEFEKQISDSMELHGRELKETICNEEFCELAEELNKINTDDMDVRHLVEEMCDVTISLKMLMISHDISSYEIENAVCNNLVNELMGLHKEVSKDIRDETRRKKLISKLVNVTFLMEAVKHIENIGDDQILSWVKQKMDRQAKRDEQTRKHKGGKNDRRSQRSTF